MNFHKSKELYSNAIDDVPNGVGVINNLSTLIDYLEQDKIIEILDKWNKHAKANNTILVYIFTKWGYEQELIDTIKNNVDSVVSLTSIEERVIIGQGFMVTSASWTQPQNNMVSIFRFTTWRG